MTDNASTETARQLAEAIREITPDAGVDAPSAEPVAETAALLSGAGAPESLAPAIVAALGESAPRLLREDPWAVLAVPGVQPANADAFARALLGPEAGPADQRRATALTVRLLERAALQGHTALELTAVRAGLAEQGVPSPDEALAAVLGEDGRVLPFQEDDESFGGGEGEEDEEATPRVLLALDRLALAEDSLADGLVRLLSTLEPAEEPWAEGADKHTAPLLEAAAQAGVVLHTGGEAARSEPVGAVRAARERGLRAVVAAASASSRSRLDDEQAVLLRELLTTGERDEEGSLALDLLAVVDAPTLDVETAATLVESLADGTRLILSGDPGELWSTGPGRVFADLLASKAAPVVASRQPDFGPIGELVSGIGIGELQQVEAPDKEVVLVTARDAAEAAHRAVQLVTDSIPRALGIPSDQVRVLTHAHAGPAGTRALNAALKARLAPGPGQFGGFDVGDLVLDGGESATVTAAGPEGLTLSTGRTVPPAEAASLRHGWALTAHQALSRRWPATVVVLAPESAGSLTRQWAYSAFNRASAHLSVVTAVGPALPEAVTNRPAAPRTTRLKGLLTQ